MNPPTAAAATEPARLRQLPREELQLRNAITRAAWPVNFNWLERDWNLSLQASCVKPRSGRFQVEADWGGARVLLRADSAWVEQVAAAVLKDVALTTLPLSLVLPVLEAAFAMACESVEENSGRRLAVVGAGTAEIALDGLVGLQWQLQAQNVQTNGEIWLDTLGMQCLSEMLAKGSARQDPGRDWSALALPVTFCVGRVTLAQSALLGLGMRDLILLDDCWLQDRQGLFVEVGRGVGFRAVLLENSIKVTEALGVIMQDNEDDYGGAGALADIPVRLSFDLGQKMLSLAELQGLETGFTFDLGRDLRHAVTIRANGMAIGEGELVEFEGRVAVSVLSLRPPEKSAFSMGAPVVAPQKPVETALPGAAAASARGRAIAAPGAEDDDDDIAPPQRTLRQRPPERAREMVMERDRPARYVVDSDEEELDPDEDDFNADDEDADDEDELDADDEDEFEDDDLDDDEDERYPGDADDDDGGDDGDDDPDDDDDDDDDEDEDEDADAGEEEEEELPAPPRRKRKPAAGKE